MSDEIGNFTLVMENSGGKVSLILSTRPRACVIGVNQRCQPGQRPRMATAFCARAQDTTDGSHTKL